MGFLYLNFWFCSDLGNLQFMSLSIFTKPDSFYSLKSLHYISNICIYISIYLFLFFFLCRIFQKPSSSLDILPLTNLVFSWGFQLYLKKIAILNVSFSRSFSKSLGWVPHHVIAFLWCSVFSHTSLIIYNSCFEFFVRHFINFLFFVFVGTLLLCCFLGITLPCFFILSVSLYDTCVFSRWIGSITILPFKYFILLW